jgi:hypothetical protein
MIGGRIANYAARVFPGFKRVQMKMVQWDSLDFAVYLGYYKFIVDQLRYIKRLCYSVAAGILQQFFI